MAPGRHHFFAAPGLLTDTSVVLRGDEARHAARVLRVRSGETVTVADGRGRVATAVVTSAGAEELAATVVELRVIQPVRPAVVLYQALAKGERMEVVVQKAAELGASRIVAYEARRSVVRWDAHKRTRARDRWRGVALAAAKQSRSAWVTDVAEIAPSAEALCPGEEVVVVLHEASARRLRDALPAETPASVGVMVGPEGGLAEAEVAVLEARTARTASLGDRILRTETAGPVALALVLFRYGALG